MTTALAIVAIGGFAFLAWRWRDIPSRLISDKLLSRDNFCYLLILGLLVIATVIGIGTSMPVISALPGVGHMLQGFFGAAFDLDNGTKYNPNATPFTDGRFGLVGSFYTATVPPLGVILALLLIVGPLLGWRDTNARRLLLILRWPALVAVIITCGALILGARDALPLAYIGLGAFAAGTNVLMIARTLRSGWLRIGGYLAHVGMAVLITGVVGSTSYATPDLKIVVPQGQAVTAYGYDFSFNDWKQTPIGKGVLDLTVTRGDDTFNAAPTRYFNPRMGATMAEPSIKSEFFRDVYISPQEYEPPNDRNTARLAVNGKQAIGPYAITFLGFDASKSHTQGSGDIGAKLRVTYQGQDSTVTPAIRLVANETDPAKAIQLLPADLPGGHSIAFENFDPVQRFADVRVAGLNLPIDPAKAVVTVSLKPGILLVWLGIAIGVLGGLIALVRHTLEGRAPRRATSAAAARAGRPGALCWRSVAVGTSVAGSGGCIGCVWPFTDGRFGLVGSFYSASTGGVASAGVGTPLLGTCRRAQYRAASINARPNTCATRMPPGSTSESARSASINSSANPFNPKYAAARVPTGSGRRDNHIKTPKTMSAASAT